jgi:hypothetical protein
VDFHAPCTLVNHHVKALYKYKMQYCGIDVDWRERTNLHAGRQSVMSSQKNKPRETPTPHDQKTIQKHAAMACSLCGARLRSTYTAVKT